MAGKPMVDCQLMSIGEINNEQRLLILNYLLSKGVKPRDLGVTYDYISKVRRGAARSVTAYYARCSGSSRLRSSKPY
ncbi:hypothetical protein [Vulcanisaeta sp. JCM 16159]|uniref:hypothetical protein n=1 Tax=Vulcanisaeta sp. JCM 16159 TaxID=1295371 RepID=UPI0006D00594|nr:hypothetical protein [Vulcanisaeta sp. JCM 16159]